MTYADSEMRGATMYAKLLVALLDGSTIQELCDYCGLGRHTVQRYVRAMRDASTRLVYVVEWAADTRGVRTRAVYRFDPSSGMKDMPRPKRDTVALKAAWHLKRKAGLVGVVIKSKGVHCAD